MRCPHCDVEMDRIESGLFRVYCPRCMREFDEEANNGRT